MDSVALLEFNRRRTVAAEPFSVGGMADAVGMSVSAFHHQFKALTASSPVQYLKSVGYESASQFSREFKRFFGASPAEEAKRMRAFIAEPAVADTRAVS